MPEWCETEKKKEEKKVQNEWSHSQTLFFHYYYKYECSNKEKTAPNGEIPEMEQTEGKKQLVWWMHSLIKTCHKPIASETAK